MNSKVRLQRTKCKKLHAFPERRDFSAENSALGLTLLCVGSYLANVLEMVAKLGSGKPPRWRVPPWMLRALAHLLRPLSTIVPVGFHPETLRASSGVTYLGDDAKARRELGLTTMNLEEGLRDTFNSRNSTWTGPKTKTDPDGAGA